MRRVDAYNATTQAGPRIRTRVVCVTISKPGVGGPHNLLKLPELGEEARKLVVDLRRVRGHCGKSAKSKYTRALEPTFGMKVGLDIPQ